MNHLKQIIEQNYSTLPKAHAINITIDIFNQQMLKINNILEQNSNEDEEILNLRKAKLYTIISEGIAELKKDNRDKSKIEFAKLHVPLLLEIIENEYLVILENGSSSTQEKIINEVFIPNYLIEWSLNNL